MIRNIFATTTTALFLLSGTFASYAQTPDVKPMHCEKCTHDCMEQCAKTTGEKCSHCKKMEHEKQMQNMRVIGDLTLSDMFMRPVATMAVPTAAYITIKNTGKTDDKLMGVTTDIAKTAEIHNSVLDDKGVMTMSLVDSVVIPAGQSVSLKPHGLHIMLMGMKQTLNIGDTIPLILHFEKTGSKMVSFPVKTQMGMENCHKDKKQADKPADAHAHH